MSWVHLRYAHALGDGSKFVGYEHGLGLSGFGRCPYALASAGRIMAWAGLGHASISKVGLSWAIFDRAHALPSDLSGVSNSLKMVS